ncbi:MAG TPA: hypothetical protein VFL70_06000 [Bacteroidia bacterium]|nr:hypothetical protein [Bacteroidia bacterium]
MTQTILLGIIGIIAVLLFAFICTFFSEIKNGIMSRMNKTLDNYKDRDRWSDVTAYLEFSKEKRSIYYDSVKIEEESDLGYSIDTESPIIKATYEHD